MSANPVIHVEIYLLADCPVCRYAAEVAALISAEYPQVQVELVEMDAPGAIIPPNVFAAPTYLLNGQRWSLGNPSPALVRQALSAALRQAHS